MRRRLAKTPIPLLGLALAALLAGCGGATKTVSVASAPPAAAHAGASTTAKTTTGTTTATTSPTTKTTTSGPAANGGTSAPATTRTAPAPAFTHERTSTGGAGTGGTGEGLSAAEAVLSAKGFTANAASEYHPNQTLRVLVGTRTGAGSAGGNGQQAFFFVDGHYIGTDAKQPSASVHVVSQSDTEVALAYALSGGGQATVRFQLNNGKLVPLGQIPSASIRR